MSHSLFTQTHETILFRGTLLKKDGIEVENASFHVRLLKKQDASKMFTLSQEIYHALRPEEQTFIRKHDDISYYENIVNDNTTKFMGVFHNGTLIGMSYIKVCSDKETFLNEIPNQETSAFENNKKVATFGGDCVLPAYRGNKINQIMVSIRSQIAKQMGCQEAYSIIDRNNVNNLTPYFANQFLLISSGIDPTDNGPIYTMKINLSQRDSRHTQIPTQLAFVRVSDQKGIDDLLNHNFQGTNYDPASQVMEFIKKPTLIRSQKFVLTPHHQQRKVFSYV